MSTTETKLVKAALEFLKLRNIPAWRNNTGAMAIQTQGTKRFVRYGHVGSADILGCMPPAGRLLAIECKSAKGKQTAAQEDFEDAITAAGGLYILARTLDDIAESLP